MDDGLMFFSSCNIRAFYPRENKPRLTLATVYKIRKRNYLYEYIFPGQYKPRLEKEVNVDQILYHLYGVNIRVFCKPQPEEAAAYFLSYKWEYGPIGIDHLRKFAVDEHLDHSFGMLAVSFQLFNFYCRSRYIFTVPLCSKCL